MSNCWQPESLPIDAGSFATLVATEPCLVIHFWAEWNGYDRQLDSLLNPIREEFANRVTFRSADIDEIGLVPVCQACKVVNVPALVCFAHGVRKWTLVGVRSRAEWRQHISSELV